MEFSSYYLAARAARTRNGLAGSRPGSSSAVSSHLQYYTYMWVTVSQSLLRLSTRDPDVVENFSDCDRYTWAIRPQSCWTIRYPSGIAVSFLSTCLRPGVSQPSEIAGESRLELECSTQVCGTARELSSGVTGPARQAARSAALAASAACHAWRPWRAPRADVAPRTRPRGRSSSSSLAALVAAWSPAGPRFELDALVG